MVRRRQGPQGRQEAVGEHLQAYLVTQHRLYPPQATAQVVQIIIIQESGYVPDVVVQEPVDCFGSLSESAPYFWVVHGCRGCRGCDAGWFNGQVLLRERQVMER